MSNQNFENNTNYHSSNHRKSSKSIDKNIIYIAIFTIIIVLLLIIILSIRSLNGTNNTTSINSNATPSSTALSILNEQGNVEATLDTAINLRKVSFSKNIKQIKAFEKKQKDTLDSPSESSSADGYTYLTYKFNPEKPASFFGTQVAAADTSSMLTYVFKNEALIEVRIQFGALGSTAYDTIVAANNTSYGQATYSRSYNNGTKQSWWKTKDTTLDIIYQTQNIIAYYRLNTK